MSSHDNDELIDYEDENDVVPNGATLAASGGATADDDKDKKNFSGIHSTGFRSVSPPLHIICVDNYKVISC
jgi:ATP-dependent RNA helicase UAP56/SUB2